MRATMGLIIAALVGAVYSSVGCGSDPPTGAPAAPPAADWRTCRSDRVGVSFRYPAAYFLVERDLSTPALGRYAIVLMEDTQEHRDFAEGRSAVPREGPPAVTLDLFENDLDSPAEGWVKEEAESNYGLSPDGELRRVTLGGAPAVEYRTDGLYMAENRVVARGNWIHMWSVTYLDPQDQIVGDFHDILETVAFE